MRVLLIEDNEDHALIVREALSGHSIVHVTTLADALTRDDLTGFEAVLTDLTLPDAAGVSAVQALRFQAPDVPLVVLTALADDRAAQQALEHGAQDYLVKEEILADHRLAASMFKRTLRYAILRHEALRENRRLVCTLQENKALLERKNERLRSLCETAQKFVENVSHDFRTPLTVIKEYSSLIRDGVVGEVTAEQRRMLHVVEDRADDLNTMVDDLLDISKFEAGLLSMWRRRTSIAQMAAHVLPGLERKAEVRGVTLSSSIDEALPLVFCDDEKVGRVIVNLVVNAIKFCRESGHIQLWAKSDPQKREVVVGITDDGTGIPPDKLKLIFERFGQASCHVRQSVKGFGLGLSIARELTDLNLGRLEVHSVLGEGSTFTFTLPHANWTEVFGRYILRVRGLEDASAVGSPVVVRAETASKRDLDDLDAFLSHNIRRDDLLLRLSSNRWLAVLLVPPVEVEEFIQRVRWEEGETNRNRPLGPLPEFELIEEGVMTVTDSLEELQQRLQSLIQSSACEPSHA